MRDANPLRKVTHKQSAAWMAGNEATTTTQRPCHPPCPKEYTERERVTEAIKGMMRRKESERARVVSVRNGMSAVAVAIKKR